MEIDNDLMNEMLAAAAHNERLRVNKDLRNSPGDHSQRMLNALLPGTFVPIHRHRNSSETVVILKGEVSEVLYDDNGVETNRYDLNAKEGLRAVQIPCGRWHSVIVSRPSVILEMKDGSYLPLKAEDVLNVK